MLHESYETALSDGFLQLISNLCPLPSSYFNKLCMNHINTFFLEMRHLNGSQHKRSGRSIPVNVDTSEALESFFFGGWIHSADENIFGTVWDICNRKCPSCEKTQHCGRDLELLGFPQTSLTSCVLSEIFVCFRESLIHFQFANLLIRHSVYVCRTTLHPKARTVTNKPF